MKSLIGKILLSFTIYRNIFGPCEVPFSSKRISSFLIKPFGKTEIVLLNPLVLTKHSIVMLLKQKKRGNKMALNSYSKTTSKSENLKNHWVLELVVFRGRMPLNPHRSGLVMSIQELPLMYLHMWTILSIFFVNPVSPVPMTSASFYARRVPVSGSHISWLSCPQKFNQKSFN